MKTVSSGKQPAVGLIVAAFGAIYVLWGSTYLAIRIAIETLPPFAMTGVRFSVAGVILFLFARRRDRSRLTFTHWCEAGICGTLMLFGGTGLVSWAEMSVPSALAALMVATVPLWLVVFDWVLFRGFRPTTAIVLGLAGGLFGVFLLIGPSDILGQRPDLTGSIVILCACVCWALGSLYSRRANLPTSSLVATSMKMLVAGVVLFLAATVTGEWSGVRIESISWRSVAALAYLIVAGSIVAFSAYSWLLHVTTPARVGTYAYVNPVVAMFLGVTLGNEVLPPRAWVAAAIIISAVVLITVSRAKSVAPEKSLGEQTGKPSREPASKERAALLDGCHEVLPALQQGCVQPSCHGPANTSCK